MNKGRDSIEDAGDGWMAGSLNNRQPFLVSTSLAIFLPTII